jgi:pyruvate dehydrogenase E2 component (dihydrolipoamide acetyltransferase)
MYEFKFPDIGEGLHEGKILELKLQPGDAVEEGDVLAIVETDKVVAEIPSPKTGVLRRFGSAAGQIIKVGDPFAYIEVEGEENGAERTETGDRSEHDGSRPPEGATIVGRLDAGDDLLPPSDEASPAGAGDDGAAPPPAAEPPELPRSRTAASGPALATPAARRLARDLNVDLGSVRGTGESGRISKEDICCAAEAHAAMPVAAPPALGKDAFGFPLIDDPLTRSVDLPAGQRVELTILRKTIARNMEISRRIPTAIVHDLGEVDELVELRTKANRNRTTHISYQPFFMKALATALRDVPVLNATYDAVSQEVTVYREVNIGFAVNTEAGVLLPVIRDVDSSTILTIDHQMKQLVAAARNRSLNADDLRGGTFALTNFGPFGGLWAAPMIFPPQVAILGIGRIHQTPRVVDGGAIEARVVLPVSLAFDHRVVDGVPAATFVSRFLELLCSPQELMVSM